MNIGIQIKQLRNKRGITQDALAQELGVTAQTVSKWETETTAPDIALLPQIAIFFGVAIDDLFALNPQGKLERLENKIHSTALLDWATFSATENELFEIAKNAEFAPQAKALLAELHLHQSEGHAEKAAYFAQKALELNPDDAASLSTLANAMYSYIPDWNARNHHELINILKEFVHKNPNNRAAYMWLLDNLLDDNRVKDAENVLNDFCKIDDSFRPVLYKRLIAKKHNDKDAETQYLKQLQTLDSDWLVCLNLGDIFAEKEQYDQAKHYYTLAIEKQPAPRYTDGAESLAHICEIAGDANGATKAYRTVLQILFEQGIVSGDAIDFYQRKIAELK